MPTAQEIEARGLWRGRVRAFVIWFAIGLAGSLAQSPVWWLISVLSALVLLVHFVWGIGQLGYNLFLGYADHRRDMALLALANLAALAFFLFAPLWHWGDRLIFALAYESQFDSVVRSVQAGGPPSGEVAGFGYQASPSGEYVVFFWLEGIPDGGTAIVYDPDDALTRHKSLSGALEEDIVSVVLESPISCWDFTGPYSKCHYD